MDSLNFLVCFCWLNKHTLERECTFGALIYLYPLQYTLPTPASKEAEATGAEVLAPLRADSILKDHSLLESRVAGKSKLPVAISKHFSSFSPYFGHPGKHFKKKKSTLLKCNLHKVNIIVLSVYSLVNFDRCDYPGSYWHKQDVISFTPKLSLIPLPSYLSCLQHHSVTLN